MGTSRKSKVIVLSVGGGGLLAGVAAYAKTGQIGQLAVHSRIKWVLNHDGTMGWWNVLCFITELILLKNMNVFLFSESFNPDRGLPACRLPCNARICESRWHSPWERHTQIQMQIQIQIQATLSNGTVRRPYQVTRLTQVLFWLGTSVNWDKYYFQREARGGSRMRASLSLFAGDTNFPSIWEILILNCNYLQHFRATCSKLLLHVLLF